MTETLETIVTGDPIDIPKKDAGDAPYPERGPDTLDL
jgi:hypothetical protein